MGPPPRTMTGASSTEGEKLRLMDSAPQKLGGSHAKLKFRT